MSEWKYEALPDGAARITGASQPEGELAIPERIDGLQVTEIGDRAFWESRGIRAVKVPEGVVVIGEKAFGKCAELERVSLPTGLREIGEGAFLNCARLEAIEIPNTVRKLGQNILGGCTALKNITLPDGLWPERAKYHEQGIGDIEQASGVTVTLVMSGKAADYISNKLTLPSQAMEYCLKHRITCRVQSGDVERDETLNRMLATKMRRDRLKTTILLSSLAIGALFFLALLIDLAFIKDNTTMWICLAGMWVFFILPVIYMVKFK